MPTQYIPVTPGTLPADYCFTTFQQLLDDFAAAMRILLPVGYAEIVISDSTPAPADQDKIWLKTDGSGNPLGFYLFVSGSWVQINPPNVFYGTGGGAGNAYTFTLSGQPDALVAGQVFIFKINATNTGGSTLQVNAFAAAPFLSAGAAMPVGGLRTNTIVAAVYDGTNFELLGGVPVLDPSQITPGTDTQRLETTSGVAGWRGGWDNSIVEATIPTTLGGAVTLGTHSLGAVPDLWDAYLENVTADQGYTAGDRIPLDRVLTVNSSNDKQAYTVGVNATSVFLIASVYSGLIIPNKTTGDYTSGDITGTIAKWKIVVSLFLF